MKHVVVLLGSPRKGDSYSICNEVECAMKVYSDVTFSYHYIYDMDIAECKGCGYCLSKGRRCVIRDDMDLAIKDLIKADGFIIACPVYACQITATLKKFLDRLAYLSHRPEFVKKPFVSIITTGGGGIKPTKKYIKMMGTAMGGWYKGGIDVIAPLYFKDTVFGSIYSSKYEGKIHKQIITISEGMYEAMKSDDKPVPTFYDLYMFNGLRSKTKMIEVDFNYWQDKGWLTSRYYYNVKLSLVKRIFGNMINLIVEIMWRLMSKRVETNTKI